MRLEVGEQALIKRLSSGMFPSYATEGSVGIDLAADDNYSVPPGETALIRTGVVLRPPEGTFALVAARSSLHKRGLMVANGVGIIDPDYCGPYDEIMVPLMNFSATPVIVSKGDRIVQVIFLPFIKPVLHDMTGKELRKGSRGGFGSTG